MQLHKIITSLLFVVAAAISPINCFHDPVLPLVYSSCSPTNYSIHSHYKTTLQLLISSLVDRGPLTGFNTSVLRNSSGRSTVYGLVQCRGDLSKESCTDCLSLAASQIGQVCPRSISARVQLNGCFLRYDNTSFSHYSTVSGSVLRYKHCNNTASNDQRLLTNIKFVMSTLKRDAPLQRNFGYNATGMGVRKVYGLAQCQADLSVEDCANCLSLLTNEMQRLCNHTIGAAFYSDFCYLRYATHRFFDLARNISGPLKDTSTCVTRRSSWDKAIVISVAAAAILIAAACLSGSIIIRGLKRTAIKNGVDHEVEFEIGPCIFKYECLKVATSNFAAANKLGEGGFGEVYKGAFTDGRQVAVKKLSIGSHQARREFLTEVKLSSCVQHRNLVKLLGCCVKGNERILVYEYMKNRSLDNLLFGVCENKPSLDWPTRRDIILGVARGLAYLHEDSQVRIVHRDIKVSNILLDENFVPKIGDFGLALHVKDNNHGTRKVAGTIGYIAPECAMHARLTEKVDVFGFGIVILEIMSGRKNKGPGIPENMKLLLEWAWRLCEEGRLLELIDLRLNEEGLAPFRDQMQMFIHIALLCAQEDAQLRPSMSRVVLMLSGVADIVDVQQHLHPDHCCSSGGRVESVLSVESLRRTASLQRTSTARQQKQAGASGEDNNSTCDGSKNLMTISEVEPR